LSIPLNEGWGKSSEILFVFYDSLLLAVEGRIGFFVLVVFEKSGTDEP